MRKRTRDHDQKEPERVAERDAPQLHRLRVREPLEELAHPERERNGRPKRFAGRPFVRVEEADRVAEEREAVERGARRPSGTRTRQGAVCVRRAERHSTGFDSRPFVEPVQHRAVERQVHDHPADWRLGASGRPDGADDELGLARRVGRCHGGRAGESFGPAPNPGLCERGRFRDPPQMLPRTARDGRRSGGQRWNEDHRQRRVAERGGAIPAHTVDRLFRRPRRAPDLRGCGFGQQLDLSRDIVIAVAEEVRPDGSRHKRRAQQKESENQQRRHDADEDVGEDQLPPDAPEQPSLDEKDEPGQEEEDRKRQGDRRRRARGTEERRHLADEADKDDEDLEEGGDDEEPPRPGIQQEVARRPARVVWRHREARRRRPAPGRCGRVRESPAGHAN